MAISATTALWFLPFVLPICFYVAFTDMREMRIPNHAVVILAVIFLVLGLIALPLAEYPWRLATLVAVLVVGIFLNAGGLVGAGDAKFAAAAAPFIDPGDFRLLIALFAANLLAKWTPMRRLAPHWDSWEIKGDFPMGLSLGGTLALHLLLGVAYGT